MWMKCYGEPASQKRSCYPIYASHSTNLPFLTQPLVSTCTSTSDHFRSTPPRFTAQLVDPSKLTVTLSLCAHGQISVSAPGGKKWEEWVYTVNAVGMWQQGTNSWEENIACCVVWLLHADVHLSCGQCVWWHVFGHVLQLGFYHIQSHVSMWALKAWAWPQLWLF